MLEISNLNDAQREAVMHGNGPLLVLAGPGSGKTYTITQRIFYLVERAKVPPEKILVITFTKDAALSMQSRFQSLSQRTLPVNFGTFHSVFYHIIKESHSMYSGQILTEAQKKKLIIPIVKKYFSTEESQYRQNDAIEDAIAMLSAISYYKNTGKGEEAVHKLSDKLQPYFPIVMKEYEQERKRQRALDFDDMVCECYRLLNNNQKLREYWQSRFSHILMDEFQDIKPKQYLGKHIIKKKQRNLFAVGDDDQSIYGFRGSNPDCLQRYVKEYQAKQICLNINYRSRKEIIQASLAVIEENQKRFRKELREAPDSTISACDATDNVVRLHAFEEKEAQYRYLISHLQDIEEGKRIGVLFRTNTYMQGFAARLSREGISYSMKEKAESIYEHFIVRDIMAYLKLALGQKSRELILQILNKPSRYISRESVNEEGEIVGSQENKAILQWERQMRYLKELSPYLAVQYVRRVIGYEVYLKERTNGKIHLWQEWEEVLNWLAVDAAGYETVTEWMDAQNIYTRSLEKRQEKKDSEAAICIMTVHASKGLEFHKVYIPDCNERVFPHGRMPNPEECEEERRVFYVAMTRAKENLELLYLTGTKERPRLPSRFLNKLLSDYSSTNSSNSQLSKYSSKASATFSYSSSSSMKSSSGSSLGSSGFS